MQNAECRVRSAECGVRSAECGIAKKARGVRKTGFQVSSGWANGIDGAVKWNKVAAEFSLPNERAEEKYCGGAGDFGDGRWRGDLVGGWAIWSRTTYCA